MGTIAEVSQWAGKHLSKTYAKKIKALNDRVIEGKRLVKLDNEFSKLGFQNNTMKDAAGKKMKDTDGNKIKQQAFAKDLIRPLIAEWRLTNTKTRQDVTKWAKENLKELPTYSKRIEEYNKCAIDGKVLLSLTTKSLTDRKMTDKEDTKATLDKIKFLKREGAYERPMNCMSEREINTWAKANLTTNQAKHIEEFNNFVLPVFDAARLLSLSDKFGKSKAMVAAAAKAKNELKTLGFKGKDEMLRQINLLKNGPRLPFLKPGRRLGEVNLSAMRPSERVLHRRRLARDSPVLAALMDEIQEAKRNPRPRRR